MKYIDKIISLFNEVTTMPFTSLKYHTLLVCTLHYNYKLGRDFQNLFLHCTTEKPKDRYTIIFQYNDFWFCSGAGMLLNKKSCELILENQNLITQEWTDDIFFGFILNQKYGIPATDGNMYRFDVLSPTEHFDINHLKNFTHIRVKIRQSDWDSIVFDNLYNLFYQ